MYSKNHRFKTSKEDKKGGAFRFVMAFLAFAIVFGSISAIVILKNNEVSLRDIFVKNTTTSVQSDSESTSSTVLPSEELSGSTNILIYCTNSDFSEIYFMAFVNADMDNQIFKVHPLTTNGTSAGKTYAQLLSTGGYKDLVSAVEANNNIKIDKYISSTTDAFALAINYMGGLEYSVSSRIEYRNDDYTLILTQGDQTIKGETLLKYFRYCNTLGAQGLKTQGDLICTMLDNYITADNVENGITIYQKLLSKINSASNISYIEAAQAMPTLSAFCQSDKRQNSIVMIDSDIMN